MVRTMHRIYTLFPVYEQDNTTSHALIQVCQGAYMHICGESQGFFARAHILFQKSGQEFLLLGGILVLINSFNFQKES
jgi:hypothetical protein